jgi:hypothetical protein
VRVQHGIVLAKSVQPEDSVVAEALRELDANFVTMMRGNDRIKTIEDQFPGFVDRYYAAGRPVLTRLLRERMPALWQAMAGAYAREMTPQQIDAAADFYRSALGQKIIRGVNQRVDAKPLLETGLQQGIDGRSDPDETRRRLMTASQQATMSSVASLPAEDRSKLVQFLVTPAGRGLRRAGPSIATVVSQWMSADDPSADAQMAEVALSVAHDMQAEADKAAK